MLSLYLYNLDHIKNRSRKRIYVNIYIPTKIILNIQKIKYPKISKIKNYIKYNHFLNVIYNNIT